MKLIASGVANCAASVRSPSFSRSSSSHDDDHLALADLLDRLLDRGEGGGGCRRLAHARASSSLSTCLARMSTSMFTRLRRRPLPGWCAAASRGSARPRSRLAQRAHREAHAVDRDRSLLHQVARQARRSSSISSTREKPSSRDRRARCRCRRRGPARCARPGDRRRAARSSRLTCAPDAQRAQRGASQRLVHRLRAKAPAVDRGRGQAHAVDGDRVALRQLVRQAACGSSASRPRRPARARSRCRGPRSGR